MVTSTWTAPGGATLSGSNPLWIGSSNQSTLMLNSLGTGDFGYYVCGVSVTPINTHYITGPTRRNASILGTVDICILISYHMHIFSTLLVGKMTLELKYIGVSGMQTWFLKVQRSPICPIRFLFMLDLKV